MAPGHKRNKKSYYTVGGDYHITRASDWTVHGRSRSSGDEGGPSWTLYRIKDTEKGPEVWEVRETRFFPNNRGVPGREQRLIIARHVFSGETKYFLSDADPEVPLKTVLYVAFSRWHTEQLFEDGKGEVGLDHFKLPVDAGKLFGEQGRP